MFKSPLSAKKRKQRWNNGNQDNENSIIINPLSQPFSIWYEFRQRIKLSRWWIKYNLRKNKEAELKDRIIHLTLIMGFNPAWTNKIIRHAVSEFSKKGLGPDYYGYHNIDHELEATYFTLIAANSILKNKINSPINLRFEDIKYLFVSALFHDYDPLKQFDKPNEESTEWFIRNDPKIKDYVEEVGIDINIVLVLIYRTAYPFRDDKAEKSKKRMNELFIYYSKTVGYIKDKDIIFNGLEHYEKLGWFLSVCERMSGYALGDYEHAKELARRNAHALGWHPAKINKESVLFFDILTSEKEIIQPILDTIPEKFRNNFQSNIENFRIALEEENKNKKLIQDKDISLICKVEKTDSNINNGSSIDNYLVNCISNIYKEIPIPLKMKEQDLFVSLNDPNTILITLRIKKNANKISEEHMERNSDIHNKEDMEVIGFVKGSPLENYKLRRGTCDENFGKRNTIYMEWICIKSGYLGAAGGNLLRMNFLVEAKKRGYDFATGYVHRNVIRDRIEKGESIRTVQKYDPDKLDYYRIDLSQFDTY